jgi:site-specific DNA-methyltransferase (adenine-specific)
MIEVPQPPLRKTPVIASTVILGDCIQIMKQFKDNEFDLAVVDPPYGIGFDGEVKEMANNNSKKWKPAKGKNYTRKSWDCETPSDEYFTELKRVSKNQIIWGGNYFDLPQSSGWIFWNKGVAKDFTLSPGELAWTSFDKSVNMVELLWAGFRKCEETERIHPTQKPVKLYDWIFSKYANEGMRILDTHLGSGSSRISADKAKLDFTGIEIDKEYFDLSEKRYQDYKIQLRLW